GLEVRAYDPVRAAETDLAFFSAGSPVSREAVPPLVEAGVTVIDNSSAFRMSPGVPLVVPEVNGRLLEEDPPPHLIANPNCSTAQLVCALAPLDEAFGLDEVTVSTYQSVSGTGRRAIRALQHEEGHPGTRWEESPYPRPIARNLLAEIGAFDKAGHGEEETKLRRETRKILFREDLPIHATAVRVPTLRGHGESVTVRLARGIDRGEAFEVLARAEGVTAVGGYTTPLEAGGRRDVFVGRIRLDPDDDRILQFWVMSDNLLKGAAWNAVQIAAVLGMLPAVPEARGE
ncbi:MAG: aspartate-semialdehyde dehydrogenase, partial [bacterium]